MDNAIISDFSKVIAIGTTEDNTYQVFNTPSEPKYIKSSRNAGPNNLEEQLIIGCTNGVSSVEPPAFINDGSQIKLIKHITYGSMTRGEKQYLLKTTSIIDNPVDNNTHTLFIDNIIKEKTGSKKQLYFVKRGSTAEKDNILVAEGEKTTDLREKITSKL